MATVTVLDPTTSATKTIIVTIESSMVIQDLLGEVEFFVTLSTGAKDVNGHPIAKESIVGLSDGAGGDGLDRHGDSLSGGKYGNLSVAIRDYIAMMVNGREGEPWTEMAFG